MPKRNKPASEEAPSPDTTVETKMAQEESPQEEDARRTRSGRRVRAPSSLLNSASAVKAPSRRTRRSAVQDLPEEEQSLEASVDDEKALVCEVVHSVIHKPDTDTADAQNENKDRKEVLCKAVEIPPANLDMAPDKKPRLALTVKQPPAIPLGKPKSGRVWKERNKQRFSSMVRDKQLCSSWEKKMKAKREKDLVKHYSQQLKDEQNRQKEEKRKRREENLKRRTENERKAEIVQVIRNTAKIKRMKKKQLRKIEKRDTLAMLQKSTDNKKNATHKAPKNIKEGPGPSGT